MSLTIDSVTTFHLQTVLVAVLALLILCVIGAIAKNHSGKYLSPIFFLITAVVLITTGVLSGVTIYGYTISPQNGLEKRAAGIEYWVCGVQVDIADPEKPLTNKIGTPAFHEHNDQQMHFEGVALKESDMSLGAFHQAIGGSISSSSLNLPVTPTVVEKRTDSDPVDPTGINRIASFISTNNEGSSSVVVEDGDKCGSDVSELQIFVYSINPDGKTYSQRKIDNPFMYIMTDGETVPNGDCVIIEFDQARNLTDRLCKEYGERDEIKCTSFGIPENKKGLCTLTESYSGDIE